MAGSLAHRAHGASHDARRSANRGGGTAVLALGFLFVLCAPAAADCTCRAGGRDYRHGQRVCLNGPDGPRLATCGMSQNVASWIRSEESCTVSGLRPPAVMACLPQQDLPVLR